MREYVLIGMVCIAGCGGYTDVYEYRLTAASMGTRAVDPEVFMRGSPQPSRPFVEVALVQARSTQSWADAMAALRKKGRQLGADALVDVRVDEGATEFSVLATAIAWVR